LPPTKRHPVMCVVDEWPSFTAGLDFTEVLAQSRGLGASWTVGGTTLVGTAAGMALGVLAGWGWKRWTSPK